MKVESFRDLIAWQRSMDLATRSYEFSRQLPPSERFGLISQIQRAAVSVPANIAEGKGRGFNRAFVNHLAIACGSLCELETHLELAVRLGYLDTKEVSSFQQEIGDVGRLITALRKSVEAAIQ